MWRFATLNGMHQRKGSLCARIARFVPEWQGYRAAQIEYPGYPQKEGSSQSLYTLPPEI